MFGKLKVDSNQHRVSVLVTFSLLISTFSFAGQVAIAPPAAAANAACVLGTDYTKTSTGGYTTLKFINSSQVCDWTIPGTVTQAAIAVVGGGGAGGGNQQPGGGGGGQVLYNSNSSVTPNSVYTVTIGLGGTVSAGNNVVGGNGGDTSFGSVSAKGGGGGGAGSSWNSPLWNGRSGGSSGGSNRNGRTPLAATQNSFSGWTSYVNAGGSGSGIGSTAGADGTDGGSSAISATGSGGGGGGAASTGGSGQSTINGTSATVSGGQGGSAIYLLGACLSGGGGAGANRSTYYTTGSTTNGTSGNCLDVANNSISGLSSGGAYGSPATANTGGGGGGTAAGGSGVVLIKYLNTEPTATSTKPTITTSEYSIIERESSPWTVPAGVTKINATAIGGGGGGGAVQALYSQGGHGGSGGGIAISILTVTPGETLILNSGAGGSAGAPGSAGSNGGSSYLMRASDSTNLISVEGGNGGAYLSFELCTPNLGGNGLIGTTLYRGGTGACGAQSTYTTVTTGYSTYSVGGGGGSRTTSTPGTFSTTYGSGGGGGSYDQLTRYAGTSGQAGAILISYTIPDAPAPDLATSSDTGSSSTDNLTSSINPRIDLTNRISGSSVLVSAVNGSTTNTCAIASSNSTSNCNLSSLTDGVWTITATQTVDGNTSSASSALTVTVDSSAGAPTLTSSPTTGNSTSATVGFSGEANATFECKVDSGSYASCTSPKTFTGLADGTHTISVRQTDYAGNVSAAATTSSWTIDATAPSAPTLTSSPNSGTSTSATVAFTGEANAAFECKVDSGSYASCTSPKTFTGLADGIHTISVRQTDSYGNTSSAATTSSWTIDTTAPSAPTLTSSPTNGNSTSATVAFTGEANATFECKVDSGSYASCSSPKTFTGLTDGTHTISVRQTDSYGNTSSAATTSSWTIDTSAPSAPTLTSSPANGNSTSATVAFTGEANATFECKVDSGSYASCASPKTFTGLNEGAHTLYVRQIDSSSNTGVAATATWSIDRTAPAVTSTTVPSTPNKSATLTYTLTFSETITGLAASDFSVSGTGCSVGSVSGSGNSYSVSVVSCSDGATAALSLSSGSIADSAGNSGPASAKIFTSVLLDRTVPNIAINSSSLTNQTRPTISGTAESSSTIQLTIGTAIYAVTNSSGNWSLNLNTATPISGTLTLNQNGNNSVTVDCTDAAENIGAATQVLVIDTTAPNVLITSASFANVAKPTIAGTADSNLTLVIAGATYSPTITNGNWELNLNTQTPQSGTLNLNTDGTNLVTVTATDAAGNQTQVTQQLEIDIVSLAAPVALNNSFRSNSAALVARNNSPEGFTRELTNNLVFAWPQGTRTIRISSTSSFSTYQDFTWTSPQLQTNSGDTRKFIELTLPSQSANTYTQIYYIDYLNKNNQPINQTPLVTSLVVDRQAPVVQTTSVTLANTTATVTVNDASDTSTTGSGAVSLSYIQGTTYNSSSVSFVAMTVPNNAVTVPVTGNQAQLQGVSAGVYTVWVTDAVGNISNPYTVEVTMPYVAPEPPAYVAPPKSAQSTNIPASIKKGKSFSVLPNSQSGNPISLRVAGNCKSAAVTKTLTTKIKVGKKTKTIKTKIITSYKVTATSKPGVCNVFINASGNDNFEAQAQVSSITVTK